VSCQSISRVKCRSYRVGIDVGGTFTDLMIADDDGIVAVGKMLTTPAEPARAIEEVLCVALEDSGIGAANLDRIVHGTTMVTNAIIERKGARTALLATEGFRDVVEMGRERRYELYDLMIELPRPLVPRHMRFDVPERTLGDGRIERKVDIAYVEQLAAELGAAGIQAIAIAFLHSYVNPANERAARSAIARVPRVWRGDARPPRHRRPARRGRQGRHTPDRRRPVRRSASRDTAARRPSALSERYRNPPHRERAHR
jgi:N-methylhydantoinase A